MGAQGVCDGAAEALRKSKRGEGVRQVLYSMDVSELRSSLSFPPVAFPSPFPSFLSPPHLTFHSSSPSLLISCIASGFRKASTAGYRVRRAQERGAAADGRARVWVDVTDTKLDAPPGRQASARASGASALVEGSAAYLSLPDFSPSSVRGAAGLQEGPGNRSSGRHRQEEQGEPAEDASGETKEGAGSGVCREDSPPSIRQSERQEDKHGVCPPKFPAQGVECQIGSVGEVEQEANG